MEIRIKNLTNKFFNDKANFSFKLLILILPDEFTYI